MFDKLHKYGAFCIGLQEALFFKSKLNLKMKKFIFLALLMPLFMVAATSQNYCYNLAVGTSNSTVIDGYFTIKESGNTVLKFYVGLERVGSRPDRNIIVNEVSGSGGSLSRLNVFQNGDKAVLQICTTNPDLSVAANYEKGKYFQFQKTDEKFNVSEYRKESFTIEDLKFQQPVLRKPTIEEELPPVAAFSTTGEEQIMYDSNGDGNNDSVEPEGEFLKILAYRNLNVNKYEHGYEKGTPVTYENGEWIVASGSAKHIAVVVHRKNADNFVVGAEQYIYVPQHGYDVGKTYYTDSTGKATLQNTGVPRFRPVDRDYLEFFY